MLEVRLLGQFDLRRDGVPIALPSRAAQSLLAHLILSPGTPHRREKLAGLLWPDKTEETARKSLRNELWRLRQALETGIPKRKLKSFLIVDDISIAFDATSDYWLDVDEMCRPLAEETSPDQLMRVLGLSRGELLPGLYEDWVVLERERVRAVYEQKMARLLETLVEGERWAEILDWGERWIAQGQSPEPAYRALMIAHQALGNVSRAAAVYERCVRALRDDLGVKPSEQTRLLFERLSKGEIIQEPPGTRPAGPVVKTAGESIPAAFDESRRRTHNLPNPLNSFIGREHEIEEVKRLLNSTRLLTLTGAGGCGKTRLALQVAADLVTHYRDGAWFADLGPLLDPALLPQTISSIFLLQETQESSLIDVLGNYLRARNVLLVLDNCEHLLRACAELSATLLRACPAVRILATSREALNIAGETTFRVPSLSLPDRKSLPPAESLKQFESIRLFVDRASAAEPHFQLTSSNAPTVAGICQKLDGMPLALELAAARLGSVSIDQIAARLDDRFRLLTTGARDAPSRQQTLRAAIDWSYQLLSEAEKALLRRLSVFAGGWTLEAAEEVCGDAGGTIGAEDPSPSVILLRSSDILDLQSRLVAKSLVTADELNGAKRYRMLETIRQYARENPIGSKREHELRERHLAYYVKFAEDAEPRLRGPDQLEWLERLDVEHDNLRVALEWSLAEGRVEAGLGLARSLWSFWDRRGYWSEGLDRVERLLTQPEAASRTLTRANALLVAQALACQLGQIRQSIQYLEELIEIAREHEPAGRRVLALGLGTLADRTFGNNPSSAEAMLEEGLGIARSLGDEWLLGFLLHLQGSLFYGKIEVRTARKAFEEALTRFESLGDTYWTAVVSFELSRIDFREGKFAEARQKAQQSLSFFNSTKDRRNFVRAQIALGEIERAVGAYEQAKRHYAEGLEVARELGSKRQIAIATGDLGFVAVHDNELDAAKSLFGESLALARDLDAKPQVALTLMGFASIAAAERKSRLAVRGFAMADAVLEKTDKRTITPADEAEYERDLAIARQHLDAATFSKAWAEGREMSLDEAMAWASTVMENHQQSDLVGFNSLPAQLSSFVGREKEIEEIKRALTETRLLMLTGSGGVGKTRLAIQVASELFEDFTEGVCFIELASLADPGLVPNSVATALGLQLQTGRPVELALIEYLRDRSCLLVLDNCEHLIEACAKLVEVLLGACPKLKLLATSREPYGIAGETRYRVPSLGVPDLNALPRLEIMMRFEAVRLFIDRALKIQPTFAITNQNAPAVAQICYRLDGIPLAIELAAARVNVLSVEQISERLDDRFHLLTGGSRTALPRQQTLRATIDWSYDLLAESEKALFRRLSVFAGGWTLEAAESVCVGNGVESTQVLELLSRLVDKSLVMVEEQNRAARYHMLETIRQYGHEKSVEAKEARVLQDRHLDWFLQLGEEAALRIDYAEQIDWLNRLDADHDNFRSALARAMETSVEKGLRIAVSLERFWQIRGYWFEKRDWFKKLLARPEAASLSPVRAYSLLADADAALDQSDLSHAEKSAEESLQIFKQLGDKQGTTKALARMGEMTLRRGGSSRAKELFEESLEVSRETADKFGISVALNGLASVAMAERDWAKAMELLEESLGLFTEVREPESVIAIMEPEDVIAVYVNLSQVSQRQGNFARAQKFFEDGLMHCRKLGNTHWTAWCLRYLGNLAWRERDLARAEELYAESLRLVMQLDDKHCIAHSLQGLALVEVGKGDTERAISLANEALNLYEQVGNNLRIADVRWIQGLAFLDANAEMAERCLISSLRLRHELGTIPQIAESLEALARMNLERRSFERSTRLFMAASTLRDAISFPMTPAERAECNRDVGILRTELGEDVFNAACAEGRAMSMAQAVEDAMQLEAMK